jgi:phosphomannomutase
MSDRLEGIFKAYDIRGEYPDEIDDGVARAIGASFAGFVDSPSIVVGRDMRTSSPDLAAAFIEGATSQGIDVVDLGEVSTDALYFASGNLGLPGAMFTASHNPSEYNGLKLCKAGAAPIGESTGLLEIKKGAEGELATSDDKGSVSQKNVLADYAKHCLSFIDAASLAPLKIAIDAGNGMAGETVPLVFNGLPVQVVPLYFELDGTFPNHPANPLVAENVEDLRRTVQEQGCAVGVAFDGDADRCFLVDEQAGLVSGSLTTALVAKQILEKDPGQSIIYNLICSRVVPETIEEYGGRPIRSRVGHSFIKGLMADTGAAFAGEHSGHYYFRDNYRADSGMIAALFALEAISQADRPLSELLEPFRRYADSGEINSEVDDPKEVLARLSETYSDAEQDTEDGLTVGYDEWWFNCRPSNTEPLLRLNLEADNEELMRSKTDEVLGLIRQGSR